MNLDPVKDFQPITPIISFPHILVVPPDSPVKTVADLAALAKSKPGGLSFGSQGVGSGGQILGEMFKSRVGVPMAHVPYRGAAPAATDIMAGRLDFLFTSYISIGEAGQGRQASHHRHRRPEAHRRRIRTSRPWRKPGYPGLDLVMWHGMVAPAGISLPRCVERARRGTHQGNDTRPDILRIVRARRRPMLQSARAPNSASGSPPTRCASASVIRAAGIKAQQV